MGAGTWRRHDPRRLTPPPAKRWPPCRAGARTTRTMPCRPPLRRSPRGGTEPEPPGTAAARLGRAVPRARCRGRPAGAAGGWAAKVGPAGGRRTHARDPDVHGRPRRQGNRADAPGMFPDVIGIYTPRALRRVREHHPLERARAEHRQRRGAGDCDGKHHRGQAGRGRSFDMPAAGETGARRPAFLPA